jgi:hypothetical protein
VTRRFSPHPTHPTAPFLRYLGPYLTVSSKCEHMFRHEVVYHFPFTVITRRCLLNTLDIITQFLSLFISLINTAQRLLMNTEITLVPRVESIMPTAAEKQLQRMKRNKATVLLFYVKPFDTTQI